MIVIDTHIWVWWVHNSPDLKPWMRDMVKAHEGDGIGVSAISCWEIARLVADQALDLFMPIGEWFEKAVAYPGVQLLDLTPPVCIEANNLPGTFHKDPADRIIVATARMHRRKLLTADRKILDYEDVDLARERP